MEENLKSGDQNRDHHHFYELAGEARKKVGEARELFKNTKEDTVLSVLTASKPSPQLFVA
jgi:hypothetical protein